MIGARTTLLSSFLLTMASESGIVRASDDDIIVERVSDGENGGVIRVKLGVLVQGNGLGQDFNDVQFERKIFTNDGNAERGASRITRDLKSAIARIDQACQLTDAQKEKLDLAGRADRKRFLDRVEGAREFGRKWKVTTRTLQMEMQSLQRQAEDGLLGPDSFFAKTMPFVLTPQQLTACQHSGREAFVESMLTEIETKVELQPSQRESLAKLMREQVQGPVVFWASEGSNSDNDIREMRHRFALVAEEKVKPLLNEVQWENLKPMLEYSRRFDGRVLDERPKPRLRRLQLPADPPID